jgi:hypothetical protein
MQALAAHQAGDDKLANFYVERFPPELRKAYDAWIAQKPFENPNADPHPFVPNLYEVGNARGRRGDRKGGKQSAAGGRGRQHFWTISRQHRVVRDCALLCQRFGKIRAATCPSAGICLRNRRFHLCRSSYGHASHLTLHESSTIHSHRPDK